MALRLTGPSGSFESNGTPIAADGAGSYDLAVEHDLGAVASDWDDLAERTGAGPFLQRGWLITWWRAFGRGRPAIVTVRRDGRLHALLSAYEHRGVLRSMTNWHTPLFGILGDDREAELAALAGALDRARVHARLAFLDLDDGARSAWEAVARRRSQELIVRPLQRSPYVPLEGDWEAFERGLGRSLRGDMRRRRRSLERMGAVTTLVADGKERLSELLEEGLALEAAGWKGTSGTAIRSSPATLRFYTEVASWAAVAGLLRLSFLRIDEKAIAFQYGLEHDGVYYFLKGGYDPAFARFSPGKLLHHAMLERQFELGGRRYEFLGDADAYKLAWAPQCHERLLFQAFRPGVAGRSAHLAYAYGRPAVLSVMRSLNRGAAGPCR